MSNLKNYHVHVIIRRAIEDLKAGKNIFTTTPVQATLALLEAEKKGQKFFTGCDHTDFEGRCLGHDKKREETTEESDQYDRDTIHQS